MKEVDIISKVVGRDTSGKAAMYIPGVGAPSVNLDDYLLKKIWDSVFEIRTDGEGNPYLFEKMPFVTQYGITMYADGGDLNLPSIYTGLPIDGSTLIRDDNGVLMINPDIDLGGGLTEVYWNDIKSKPTFAAVATSGKYADLSGLPDLSVYATTEYLTAELKKYVTLNTEQTIAAHKNFLNGLSVGGLGITKSQDDVVYIDANLVVRGGITMYATDAIDVPSIIEALPPASSSVKGIAAFNPNDFSVVDGYVSFTNDQGFASTLGGLKNVGSWADSAPTEGRLLYQAAGSSVWSYKNFSEFVSESGSYLPLTGGTLSGPVFSTAFGLTSRGSGTYNVSTIQYDSEYGLYFEAAKESDSNAAVKTSMYFGWRGGEKAMVIRGNGNIGIGFVSPSHKLEVNGDAYFNGSISLANGRLIDSLSTSGTLYNILEFNELNTVVLGWSTSFASCPTFLCGHYIDFYTGGSTNVKMRLSRDGNLGIGFISPSHKLEVNGDAYFSGFAQTGGYVRTGSGVAFYNIGTGTYNIATLTVDNNYGMFFDAARGSDNGSASKLPFGWFWRGDNSPSMTLSSGGNLLVSGGITMYSDIRKKTKLQDVELTLQQIADAPLIEHYYNSDAMRTTHVGSIAQYWAGLNNWFCKLDNEGFYTMEIQNAALASAISIARELSRYETKTDRKIRLLKQRVKELEDKIEKLENN